MLQSTVKTLSANPAKRSNTLKQFALIHNFVGLTLKGLQIIDIFLFSKRFKIWVHTLSAYTKFSEKLKFLTPWYANVRMRIRELEMLVLRKILPTYLMDDPFPNVYFSSWNILWKTTDFLYLCKTKPTKRNNIFKPNIRSFPALNTFVKLTHCMLEMTFGYLSQIFKILGNTNGRVGSKNPIL